MAGGGEQVERLADLLVTVAAVIAAVLAVAPGGLVPPLLAGPLATG